MLFRSRRVLPVSVLLLAAACEPLTCQGRIDNAFDDAPDDAPIINARCGANGAQFVGDVDINTQQELDTLIGCNAVEGSILIHDSTDIVDLGALAALTSINKGYLLAINNAALTNMQLPALQRIDTGLAAIDNPELLTVNLPELAVLEGDLTMRNNPKLTQLAAPKVEVIKNAIIIIDGVEKVVSFGNFILGDVPALTSLENSFPILDTIDGSVQIYNTGLLNFSGLEKLEEIKNTGGKLTEPFKQRFDKLNPGLSIGIDFDSDFNIVAAGNPNLKDFSGLDALNDIVGDVMVGFNPELESFTGLDDIKTINGNLFVIENESLTSFLGLEGDNDNDDNDDGLSVINGNVFLGLYFDRFGKGIAGGNDALVDLDGMQSLTTITGDLVLAFNGAMEDLNGLTIFTTLGGDLTFLGQNMDSFKGADLLTTIGGDLNFGQLLRVDGQPFDPDEIDPANKLTDLFDKGTTVSTAMKFDPGGGANGFDALTTIGGNLIVAFSDINDLRLSDIEGDNDRLPGADLTTVGGSLIMYGNDAPDQLDGIETLDSLGGLVINFAIDAFGELQPIDNNGFSNFAALDVDLGAGGLVIGFDDDLDGAALATLRAFASVDGDVVLASVDNENNRGPANLGQLNITTIGGDLVVCAIKNGDDAPIPADLDNLEALNLNAVSAGTVVGDVIIAFCSSLADTTMNITTIGGSFELTDLPAVENINGLGTVGAVGELLLHDLPEVVNIDLPALTNVGANLEIVNNPQLEGFNFALNQVGGTLRLVNLGSLEDVDGLSTLDVVGGDLEIIDCDAIANTAGLNGLSLVGGSLRLRRLTSITNQAQQNGTQELTFNTLVQVGGLEITQMADLEDLAGLQTIVRVGVDAVGNLVGGGVLTIDSNPKLKTLFGLQGIENVGHKISILNNPLLDRFAFDDDDQDRELDIDEDNDAGADEEDDTNESGFSERLDIVGAPLFDGEVLLGGQTGIIEVRNNPLLREKDGDDPVRNNRVDPGILDTLVDNLADYEGLLLLCGNEDSGADADPADRSFFSETCAEAQDGLVFAGEEVPADGA